MKTTGNPKKLYAELDLARKNGKTIGVVPTMGALHPGHLSLVARAREKCDIVVATIFVNPTQFAPHEDLDKYPRPIEKDLACLEEMNTDFAFCPENHDIYPPGFSTYVSPPDIARPFEGSSRQSHFQGVTTVVLKLFQIVPATRAFFGQKDYQQALVIQKMAEDLNLPVEIEICPIVREPDGLAMSSRNVYLSLEERERALSLRQNVLALKRDVLSGRPLDESLADYRSQLEKEVDELEYLDLVDARTLQKIENSRQGGVILVAARVGSTRLIDNELVQAGDAS